MYKSQCDQCYKEFSNDDQQAVQRSLRAHINKTGHTSAVLVEGKGSEEGAPTVATEAPAKEKEAKVTKVVVSVEEKAAARAKAAEEKQAAREADRASRPCECGCGGVPKGFKSRFIPGHDAKLASAEKATAEAAKA